jgi:hypothetical protein
MDDVLFNQSGHLAGATVLDCTTLYRIDGIGFASIMEMAAWPVSAVREAEVQANLRPEPVYEVNSAGRSSVWRTGIPPLAVDRADLRDKRLGCLLCQACAKLFVATNTCAGASHSVKQGFPGAPWLHGAKEQ